jgi:hypothetical protein
MMKPEDHVLYVATLLELVQRMEQTLKDYCRLLTAHDDGHCLETDNADKEPF